MAKERIHLALVGIAPNVPAGPMVSPRPGPTLASAVPAPEIAVIGSSPVNASAIEKTTKLAKNNNRKLITELMTFCDSGRPL